MEARALRDVCTMKLAGIPGNTQKVRAGAIIDTRTHTRNAHAHAHTHTHKYTFCWHEVSINKLLRCESPCQKDENTDLMHGAIQEQEL